MSNQQQLCFGAYYRNKAGFNEPRGYIWASSREEAKALATEEGWGLNLCPEDALPVVPRETVPLMDKCPKGITEGSIYDPVSRPTFSVLAAQHLQSLPEREILKRLTEKQVPEDYVPYGHKACIVLSSVGSPYGRGYLPKKKADVEFSCVERFQYQGVIFERKQLASIRLREISY